MIALRLFATVQRIFCAVPTLKYKAGIKGFGEIPFQSPFSALNLRKATFVIRASIFYFFFILPQPTFPVKLFIAFSEIIFLLEYVGKAQVNACKKLHIMVYF